MRITSDSFIRFYIVSSFLLILFLAGAAVFLLVRQSQLSADVNRTNRDVWAVYDRLQTTDNQILDVAGDVKDAQDSIDYLIDIVEP